MKRVGLITAAILIAFLSLFFMHTQKMHESVQLWEHYNIVYIPSNYSEAQIYEFLLSNGAEGVISKENSLFSVKNAMLPTLPPYNNEGFTSESIRSFFFKDQANTCFLFYVPESSLENVTAILNKGKIPFGVDAAAQYPVLCPILCFSAFLILMLLNRVHFTKALCLLPLVTVSYAVPFYSVSAAICCFLFVFMIIDLYEGRKGAVRVLCRKVFIYLVFTAGVIASVMSGRKSMLLCLTGLGTSCILLFLRDLTVKEAKEKEHFLPVSIITAPWINIRKRYNGKTLVTLGVFMACFVILSLFSGFLDAGTNAQDLLLPAPSGYTVSEGFTASAYAELAASHTEDRKPDLTDFLNEKWYAETAAYRKVNYGYKTAEAYEEIVLPSFTEDESGLIIKNDKVVFKFDDSWISSTAEDYGNSSGVENLLVSQSGFFGTGYSSSGKYEYPPFVLPAAAVCALCFLILIVVYVIKRLKK